MKKNISLIFSFIIIFMGIAFYFVDDFKNLLVSNNYEPSYELESIPEYNGKPYRMLSLESIYNTKKNARPKDRYDAQIIKKDVDMLIDYRIDVERRNNFDRHHQPVFHSSIQTIEKLLKEQQKNKDNEKTIKNSISKK